MIVKNAEFVISAVGSKQYPTDGLPEIALAGRSNVGKSSLVNKFVNRKNLARTSSKPGKTQTLNYYRVNNDFYFVDLPGYGFAQVSRQEQERWKQFIDAYLTKRELLAGVIQIVDMRHPPSRDDVQMYEWLKHIGQNILLVATKCDKLSRGQWQKQISIIRKTLCTDNTQPIIAFSAQTGQGLDDVMQWIENHVNTPII